MEQVVQVGSDVKATLKDGGQTVTFEKIAEPAPTGQAYVELPRAKSTRELEMEAGKKRVEQAKEQLKNRPPRIISDAERRAEGHNVSVFNPNSVYADRVVGSNGSPVSQQLGALMRKVGGGKAPLAG